MRVTVYILLILLVIFSCASLRKIEPKIVCPKPKLIGWQSLQEVTLEEWKALGTAQKNCKKHFKHSVCLKQFIKKGESRFHAVCGMPSNHI